MWISASPIYLVKKPTRKWSIRSNFFLFFFFLFADHLIKEHFKTVPKLEYLVKRYVLKHLEGCRAEVTQRTSDLLAQENEEIFTLNHYYSDTVAKIKQHISNNLAKPPVYVPILLVWYIYSFFSAESPRIIRRMTKLSIWVHSQQSHQTWRPKQHPICRLIFMHIGKLSTKEFVTWLSLQSSIVFYAFLFSFISLSFCLIL